MYMESRKMLLMNLAEKRLVDLMAEGKGGMNWESSINIYTLICKIDSGKLLNNTGTPTWSSVMT